MMVEPWSVRKIRDFASRSKVVNVEGDPLPPLSITKDRGVVLQSEKYKKQIATDLRKYVIARRDQFAFDPMSLYYGAIGRVGSMEVGLVSPDYVVFNVDETVDKTFLNYLLRSPHQVAVYEAVAETGNQFGKRRRVYWSVFEELEVRIPPLAQQRKIAAILLTVDEATEATRSVIDQLQVVKKVMMTELLTRGLPGRHTQFKQTEIGEVPEEWTVGPLREFAALSSGGTPNRTHTEFWNGGIPWVKTGEINYGVIMETEETISSLGLASSSAKMLEPGTLLMAMYGQGVTRGRVAMLGIRAAVNQACLAISPAPDLSARFLFHIFSHRYDELRTLGHEGSQKNLSARLVGDVVVPKPPSEEQADIVTALDCVATHINAETSFSAGLARVKHALMSVLLTGEIRVTPDEVET